MTVRLHDVLNLDDLAKAQLDGYVRRQVHPTLPLEIWNYTEKAQFDRAWNGVTLACRGLISNTQTDEVIARPFEKFFNYGEHPEASLAKLMHARAEVTDKLDGSLGILYQADDGWSIATRGSFASEQAIHATQLYRERYQGTWTPVQDHTYLFEIIYPANRIVCDYGGMDDLVLLGCVDNETGLTHGPNWIWDWRGPRTEVFETKTLADALAMEPRAGAEGVVVRLIDRDIRIKIKQEDYVALHKLVTGMNERAVWERLGAGDTVEDIQQGLPEEFWPWVRGVGYGLLVQLNAIVKEAQAEHNAILAALPEGWSRKDYAALAQKSEHRAWLFMILDGRDPSEKIWRTLRPSAERSMIANTEEAA